MCPNPCPTSPMGKWEWKVTCLQENRLQYLSWMTRWNFFLALFIELYFFDESFFESAFSDYDLYATCHYTCMMNYPKVKVRGKPVHVHARTCTMNLKLGWLQERKSLLVKESEIVCLHALLQPSHCVIETAQRTELTEEEMKKVISDTRWLESYYLLSATCYMSQS